MKEQKSFIGIVQDTLLNNDHLKELNSSKLDLKTIISHPEIIITVPEDDFLCIENLDKIACHIQKANLFNLTAYIHNITKIAGKSIMYAITLYLKNNNYKNLKSGMISVVTIDYYQQKEVIDKESA